MRYLRSIILVCLLLAVVFLAADGALYPENVAASLADVELVEAGSLTKTGRILVARDDGRVPKLLVDLLKDEDIPRVYTDCTFNLVDGHPVWTWWLIDGVIYESDTDALRKRLEQRLNQLGFESREIMAATSPQEKRFGWLTFHFQKNEPHRQWWVDFGSLRRGYGGQPTVGFAIACSIRGTNKCRTPTLAEVLAAAPDLVPPAKGQRPIPPSVLEALKPLPVTRAHLSGTGKAWYVLNVTIPLSSLKDSRLEERLEELLIAEDFEKRTWQPPKGAVPSLYYRGHGVGASNCQVKLSKLEDDCTVDLFVQIDRSR